MNFRRHAPALLLPLTLLSLVACGSDDKKAAVAVVENTVDLVRSFFQVPTVGPNTKSCAGDAFTPGSQYIKTTCSIGPHYHPNASLTFTDK